MPPRVRAPAPLVNHMYQWRKAKGFTLQQVADAIGTTKGHLSNIENGGREMMPALAEAVAVLFGISSDALRNQQPSDEVSEEQQLLALFRDANPDARKAMLANCKIIAELARSRN